MGWQTWQQQAWQLCARACLGEQVWRPPAFTSSRQAGQGRQTPSLSLLCWTLSCIACLLPTFSSPPVTDRKSLQHLADIPLTPWTGTDRFSGCYGVRHGVPYVEPLHPPATIPPSLLPSPAFVSVAVLCAGGHETALHPRANCSLACSCPSMPLCLPPVTVHFLSFPLCP